MIAEAEAEPEEAVVRQEVQDAAVVHLEVAEVEEPRGASRPSSSVTDDKLRLLSRNKSLIKGAIVL